MSMYAEFEPRLDKFKATREHVISSAKLPPADAALSFGEPPFAIDDGTDCYAVIDKDGNVSPLPFGYQVPDEYLADADAIFSKPVSSVVSGMSIVRFVPLVDDFSMPGDRAFCLETAEDFGAWEAVGQAVEVIQNMVNEKALFNFNQRLSNALVSLYAGYEELESVDQTISALFMNPSVLAVLLLRSYQHAIDSIEEEMSAEEDDDE